MAYTPQEWTTILHPATSNTVAKDHVITAVREALSPTEPAMPTKELVDRLFPEDQVRGPGMVAARWRLVKLVTELARTELKGWAFKDGAERQRYGKLVKSWYWRANPTDVTHVGGGYVLPLDPHLAADIKHVTLVEASHHYTIQGTTILRDGFQWCRIVPTLNSGADLAATVNEICRCLNRG